MQTDSSSTTTIAPPAARPATPSPAAPVRAPGERRSARRFIGPSLERGAALALARRVAVVAAAATAIVAALALVGWQFDVDFLKRFGASGFVMLPATAVAQLLAGVALLLLGRRDVGSWRRRIAAVLAAMVLVIGVATLVEWAIDAGSRFDLLLFADAVRRYPFQPPGRMAVNSAVSFALAGAALLLLPRRPAAAQMLATIGLLIALTAVIGYTYGFRTMYAIDRIAGMALVTALTLVLLQTGILLARADVGLVALTTGDDLGALLSRRLLPAAAIVPVLLGLLWLTLRRHGTLGREAGVGFFVVLTIIVMTMVVLWTAHLVRSLDREREALLESEAAARHEAERARRDAEEANRAKSEFLAVMSHELRTPLNAIAGYTQLLSMELRGPITDAQRSDLERIERSEKHLLSLIDDVLSFAKAEAGRIALEPRVVALDRLIGEVVDLVRPELEAKRLACAVEGCDPPPRAIADPEKLRQVLVNLLANAVKFTERGGVRVSCVRRGDAVAVEVRDTGRGIPADQLERIFEPFVQVDRRTISGSRQGVGLGLAISRDLARAMGGDIVAASVLGEGATFTVTMPAPAGG